MFAESIGLDKVSQAESQLYILGKYFLFVDTLCAKYSAEKIKTIGYTALITIGFPRPVDNPCKAACSLAVDIAAGTKEFATQFGVSMETRIGISFGTVIGGIMGISKPNLDVWGDCVNLAARLQQTFENDSVHVSDQVFEQAQGYFSFEETHKQLKGLGNIQVFSLKFPFTSTISTLSTRRMLRRAPTASFILPSKRRTTAFELLSNQIPCHSSPWYSHILLLFSNRHLEFKFIAEFTESRLVSMFWTGLVTTLASIYIMISYREPKLLATRNYLSFIDVCMKASLTFIALSQRLSRLGIITQILTSTISSVGIATSLVLFYTGLWGDKLTEGIIIWITLLHFTNKTVAFALPQSFIMCVIACPLKYKFPERFNNSTISIMVAMYLLLLVEHFRQEKTARDSFETNEIIQHSELLLKQEISSYHDLLSSVLPSQFLAKLDDGSLRTVVAEHVDSVTILFADVCDFTPLCNHQEPFQVVNFLQSLFSMFDSLCERYGLSRLKTIGDAYVVTANALHECSVDHANKILKLAIDMIHSLEKFNREINTISHSTRVRIGVHTGSVLAGVIKMRVFSFDCWGKGMQIVEQLQKCAVPNTVVVSESTVAAVSSTNLFTFQPVAVSVEGFSVYQLSF